MIFVLKLDRQVAKLALILPVVLAGGLLVGLIRTHFIIRQMSDIRFVFAPEAYAAVDASVPQSARLNLGLARSLLREGRDFAGALLHAERAVRLSPHNDAGWQVLAQIQDVLGPPAAAEMAWQRAVELAPHNSDASWALANALLRNDKVEDALPYFAKACELNETLYPLAFELLWQVNGQQLESLQRVAGTTHKAQMSLVQFLAEQDQFDSAATLFKTLDRRKLALDPLAPQFVQTLIARKQFSLARAAWLDLIEGVPAADGNLIWNGDFEMPPVAKLLSQFDWQLGESKFARFGIEAGRGRNGSKALKAVFLGRDTTQLNGEVFQLLALKPGVQYRLEAYAKTEKLVTPEEGLRLAVYSGSTQLGASTLLAQGSNDWQRLAIEFTAPTTLDRTIVTLVRLPKYAYDDPTSGEVWFDDFSLRMLGVEK